MQRAEFDPVGGLMLAVLDDTDPWRPRQPTGAPATPGVEPIVLPLRVRWPDPYLADLPELLGPMVLEHDVDLTVLTQTFPSANYSPTTVRAARRANLDREARQALAGSDWTVVRQLETGKAVPEVIARRRAAVRAWHEYMAKELAGASLFDLVDGDRWRLPPALQGDLR